MISYKHRFHGHNALRGVYSNGQTVRTSSVALKYALNERRKEYRVAVVVSKKVSKSAVKRNRIRRRIFEIVRSHENNITRPFDLVLTVHSDSLVTMPAKEIEDQISKLLLQAGCLS